MSGPQEVQVTVEIVVGASGGIRGTAVGPDGRRVPFSGWLGLIDGIYRYAPGDPPPEPPRRPA